MNQTQHRPDHSILSGPLPGKIMKILVREGDRVEKGQSIFVIESMKMFHELRVTHNGRMTTIAVKEGDCVLPNTQIASLVYRKQDACAPQPRNYSKFANRS